MRTFVALTGVPQEDTYPTNGTACRHNTKFLVLAWESLFPEKPKTAQLLQTRLLKSSQHHDLRLQNILSARTSRKKLTTPSKLRQKRQLFTQTKQSKAPTGFL